MWDRIDSWREAVVDALLKPERLRYEILAAVSAPARLAVALASTQFDRSGRKKILERLRALTP